MILRANTGIHLIIGEGKDPYPLMDTRAYRIRPLTKGIQQAIDNQQALLDGDDIILGE